MLNLGTGSTWPGHIALQLSPRIITSLSSQLKKGVIVIAGTNGKTTTSKMVTEILINSGNTVITNHKGANLLNGIASCLLTAADFSGKIDSDWAVFEVDEATFPLLLTYIKPHLIVFLNLFRDQLDRYGEIDTIAGIWKKSLANLDSQTTLVLNADDPGIAFLGNGLKAKTVYFGINDHQYYSEKLDYASDSIFCPRCNFRLNYITTTFSHLGNWVCPKCNLQRPNILINKWDYFPLPGTYNVYNTLAGITAAKVLGVNDGKIRQSLEHFLPAFGRQEEIGIGNKKIVIYLSKNPTGFNESLKTVIFRKNLRNIIIALNDNIPDGRDISWIWDVDFEMLKETNCQIMVSGKRALDMTLRLKYAGIPNNRIIIESNLNQVIQLGLKDIRSPDILYILPTYSAMLEARKILGTMSAKYN